MLYEIEEYEKTIRFIAIMLKKYSDEMDNLENWCKILYDGECKEDQSTILKVVHNENLKKVSKELVKTFLNSEYNQKFGVTPLSDDLYSLSVEYNDCLERILDAEKYHNQNQKNTESEQYKEKLLGLVKKHRSTKPVFHASVKTESMTEKQHNNELITGCVSLTDKCPICKRADTSLMFDEDKNEIYCDNANCNFKISLPRNSREIYFENKLKRIREIISAENNLNEFGRLLQIAELFPNEN